MHDNQDVSVPEQRPVQTVLRAVLIGAVCSGASLSSCSQADLPTGSGTGAQLDVPIAVGDGGQTLSRSDVVRSIGENVIVPTYQDASERIAQLGEAVDVLAEDPSDDHLQDARAAWLEAMAYWQIAEVLQVGPAGASTTTMAGQDLRDRIYSWPLTNPCRVDMALVDEVYADFDEFKAEAPTLYGFDALEYLLFNDELDHSCSSTNRIAEEGAWQDLGEGSIVERRYAYALAITQLLSEDVAALLEAWEPGEGDFLEQLASAGEDSETFDSSQEALNAITDALFYLEKETKDLKLAIPTGISDVCATDTCPEDCESLFANVSLDHVRNNLKGFERAYLGGQDESNLGLDDLLRAIGQEELDQEIQELIGEAYESVDATGSVSMVGLLQEDPDRVRDVHEAYKALLDLFKTQVMSVLSLSLPMRAASDTD